MKRLISCIAILTLAALIPQLLHAQSAAPGGAAISLDKLRQAPPDVQRSKAYQREKWFYEQRAWPGTTIPADGRAKAIAHRDAVNKSLRKGSGNSRLFSFGTWTMLGPAPGLFDNWGYISGRTTAVMFDKNNPGRVFAGGAAGGVWRSSDKGINWTPLTDHEASLATGSIAIDPNNSAIVYVGTGEATYSGTSYYGAGILKSTDGGDSWQDISSGIPLGSVTSRILVMPNNSNVLLLSLGPRGIYRSVDGGVSWNQISGLRVDDMVINPADNYVVYAVGGDGTGLLKSVDAGVTWKPIGAGLPRQAGRMQLDLCRDLPSTMYAATYGETGQDGKVLVYKSVDGGDNWTRQGPTVDFKGGQAWYDFYVRASYKDPAVCFVGTIEILRTTDGGATWKDVSKGYSGGFVHVDQHDLRFDPVSPNTIICSNDGGVYISTDLGETWGSRNEHLVQTQFYRISADPNDEKHIFGGTQDNGTQQTRGLLAWTLAFGGDGMEAVFSPGNPNYMLGESQNGGLNRSSNGGYNWAASNDGLLAKDNAVWVAPILPHPKKAKTFYHGRTNFYVTTNGGLNWEMPADSLFGSNAIEELAISNHPTTPVLYATQNNKVRRSADDGVSWTPVAGILPSRGITSIYTHPSPDSSNLLFVTLSGFGTNHIYRTGYDGNSWLSIDGNLPDVPVNDLFIHPDYPNSFYVAATDIGVFFTENGGETWSEMSNGLPNTIALNLDYHVASKKLRVGTHGRSVWEITLTPLPVEPPRNLAASAGSHTATIDWDPSPTAGVKNYSVYRGTKTGLGTHVANTGTALSWRDPWLENDRTYYYRVRAVTAADSSLFSGEVTATPKVWQGCLGSVLSLNAQGTGDFMLLPPRINNLTAMTVEGWVWWKAFKNWSRFVDFGERDKSFLIANEGATNNLSYQIYDTTGSHSIYAYRILTTDRPVHIAAVSGPGGMKLYVDGNLVGTNLYTGSTLQTRATKINNYVGRSNWSGDLNFVGEIDEFRVWKTERSEAQIRADFNRTLSSAEIADTNLVAYINFERSDDTLAFDQTARNNNGRLRNSAEIVTCEAPVSVSHDAADPASFALDQNHPNPFGLTPSVNRDVTSIGYTIDRRCDVTLDVYNTLGVRVARLIENEPHEPGSYDVPFNAGGLPSGVYLYIMRAGERIASRKMTLMR